MQFAKPILGVCSLLSASLLSADLTGQTTIVSPAAYTNKEGPLGFTVPFSYGRGRYQQVHGDLRKQPGAIRGLAWRRDGHYGTNTSMAARSLEVEVWIGEGDFTLFGTTFDKNYAAPPTQIVAKQKFNFPDWFKLPATTPAPFNASIPFTKVGVYTGKYDFIWELKIHSMTPTSMYYSDYAGGRPGSFYGSYRRLGVGCKTGLGGPDGMRLTCSVYAVGSAQLNLSLYGSYGVPSAPSAILIGVANLNLQIPGLCTRLYPHPVITLNRTASSTGSVSGGRLAIWPYNPIYKGSKFYAQVASLDASQKGLPVAASNGIEAELPGLDPIKLSNINYRGGPNGSAGSLYVGAGLVTRITR